MRPNAWPGSTYPLFGGAEAKYEQKTKTIDTKKEAATCTNAGGSFLFLNHFRSVDDPSATMPEMIQLPEPVFLSSAVHGMLSILNQKEVAP